MAVIARWTLDMDAERNVIYGVREGHGHPPVGKPFVSVEVVPDSQLEGAVDEERIARALAERIVGVQVRREDEPVVVSRVHRDLAAYIVRGQ